MDSFSQPDVPAFSFPQYTGLAEVSPPPITVVKDYETPSSTYLIPSPVSLHWVFTPSLSSQSAASFMSNKIWLSIKYQRTQNNNGWSIHVGGPGPTWWSHMVAGSFFLIVPPQMSSIPCCLHAPDTHFCPHIPKSRQEKGEDPPLKNISKRHILHICQKSHSPALVRWHFYQQWRLKNRICICDDHVSS